VPEGSRLRFGRFYTPPGVADLALGLAIRDPSDRVWDPTCGDGAFLRQAAARGHPVQRLTGHDLDGGAVEATRAALPGASVSASDLFALDPADIGPFEAIAGNPPFVRVERLPEPRRRALRRAVRDGIGWEPPARADLSVLALLHCLRFLAPGGRLAFVMPNTWMDADFGRPVRDWLAERYRLVAVVESRSEPWFPEARVNTVIVVFEAPPHAAPTAAPAFVRCLAPTSGALAPAILGEAPVEPDQLQLRRRSIDGRRWSVLLRAPDAWFEVQERAGDRLVRLGDASRPLLQRGYGTKVGIAAFFSPSVAELDRAGVEESCRRPFIRSLRRLHRYRVGADEVDGVLFACDDDVDPTTLPGASAWIRAGAGRRSRQGVPWPEVPSVRTNKPWHRLHGVQGGDVILPQFRMRRHYAIDNPDRVPVNNSAWWGRWLDPAWRQVGTALLNSTWVALAAEVTGRVNLGEGLLTCYGPDLDAIPLPDPARYTGTRAGALLLEAWERLVRREVLPLEEEVGREDRRALDAAVLLGLDLPADLGEKITDGVVRLCQERQQLASSLRVARSRLSAKER
jgi:adenine-specific DNA-methyltransferase